jgi:predicted small metal-binding protein
LKSDWRSKDKTLRCSDVGFDCAAVMTAAMAEEIARKIEE